MTVLEIKEIKHDLIRSIFEINDASVLGEVRDYLENIQEKTIDEIPGKSIEEIDRLLLQSETSGRTTHEEFRKRYGL